MLNLRFTLLIGLLCLVSSVIINKTDDITKITFYQNLQFDNYTGSGVDQSMKEKFLDTIRKGYLFHRDSMKDNILYIRSSLESHFSRGFTVAIYDKNVTGGYSFYSYNSTYAIWTKVNSQKPQWVYVIIMASIFYGNDYDYICGVGSGITSTKLTVIKNIITAAQKKYVTPAYIADQIGNSIKQYDGLNWSVITIVRNTTIYASINDYNHQYYIPESSVSLKFVHLIFTYNS